ncbi:MAG TPA: ankyrin repeat domain-containing protein [Pyrinomonadaceae bacterium]|nr:ankyrin repeat domain-containing protein [Pyrinomonadaceae bacterium]
MTDASRDDGRQPANTQKVTAAVNAGDAALVKSLLAAGASPNAAGYNGRTVLMRAASSGRAEVVRALLDAGADVDAKKEDGATALVLAVFFGHAEIVRLLLAAGADPSAPTPQGVPLFEWAEAAGFEEVAGLLRSAASARARGETVGRAEAELSREDAASIFPSSGPFRPVVPLTEIEAASDPSAPGGPEQDARDDGPEETTLVPARVRAEPAPDVLAAARPRFEPSFWAAVVLSLALGAAAGLLLDLKWGRSRQPAEKVQPRPAEASPAAVAAQPQPAPPAPQPSAPTAAGSEVVANSPADIPAGEGESEAARAGIEGRDSTPRAAPSETASPGEPQPQPRRAETAEAGVREPPPSPRRAKAGDSRPAPARAASPARNPAGRATTAASTTNSVPVSSPPPSAKSEKVIQWP